MTKSRIPSLAAVGALVAASTLLVASPAAAETTLGEITFYGESDFGEEVVNGTWPSNDWFFGNVEPNTPGSYSFGPSGLTINDGAPGVVQILNQDVTTPADVDALIALVDSARVVSDTEDWHFQLPFFGEGASDTQFTTLRPETAGQFNNVSGWADEPNAWRTSWAIPGHGADTTGSFRELATALYADEAPELLAYGLWFGAGDSLSIFGIEWDGTASGFGPVPTRTITPTTISVDDFASTGVTFSGTGWMPGSELYLYIDDPDGNEVYYSNETLFADSNGNVSYTLILPNAEPGTYSLNLDDDGFLYYGGVWGAEETEETLLFFTVEAETLPASGAAVQGLVIGAGLLLVAGTVITVVLARRA